MYPKENKTKYIYTRPAPFRCQPTTPALMSVAIHYDLDILAANMSSQGCDVDRLHKKIQFHAQTESTPSRRRRLKIHQQAQGENHGTLGFDVAELLQCMDDAAMPRVDSNDQRDMEAMAACAVSEATEPLQSYPFSTHCILHRTQNNNKKHHRRDCRPGDDASRNPTFARSCSSASYSRNSVYAAGWRANSTIKFCTSSDSG